VPFDYKNIFVTENAKNRKQFGHRFAQIRALDFLSFFDPALQIRLFNAHLRPNGFDIWALRSAVKIPTKRG
jgi:hypothetical protein